jgi:hypothetical protein
LPPTPGAAATPGEIDYSLTDPGAVAETGISPMERAFRRAVPPVADLPGVNPAPPGLVSGMPVGQSTVNPAVLNEANIRSGATPPPEVPFQSAPASRTAVPEIPTPPNARARLVQRSPRMRLRL